MKLSISKAFIDHCHSASDISVDDLRRIIASSSRDVGKLAGALVKEGWFTSHDIGKYIADNANCSYVDMSQTVFQGDALSKVPKTIAVKLCAIPLYTMGQGMTVAMANPFDENAKSELQKYCDGLIVSAVFSLPDDIQRAIETHYSKHQLN